MTRENLEDAKLVEQGILNWLDYLVSQGSMSKEQAVHIRTITEANIAEIDAAIAAL